MAERRDRDPDARAARAAAHAAAIQSCYVETIKLLRTILNLQNDLFRLQANENPNGVQRGEMENLIKQIARLKLIMNLFNFCIICIKNPRRFETHLLTFDEPYPNIDKEYILTKTSNKFLKFDLREFFTIMKETLDRVFNDFDVFDYIHDNELDGIEGAGILGGFLHEILNLPGEYDERCPRSIVSYLRSILLAAFENTEQFYEDYQEGIYRRFNLTLRKWLLQLCVNVTKTTHSWFLNREDGARDIFLNALQCNSRTCQSLVPKFPKSLFYFFNFKRYKHDVSPLENSKRTIGEILSILNSLKLIMYTIKMQNVMGNVGGSPPTGQLLKALIYLCNREYPMQVTTQFEIQKSKNPINPATMEFLKEIRATLSAMANEASELSFQLLSGAGAAGNAGPAVEDVIPRLNGGFLNSIADYKPPESPSVESQIVSFLRNYDNHNLYRDVTVNAFVPMLIQEGVTQYGLALDDGFASILIQLFAATGPGPEIRAENLRSMLTERLNSEQNPNMKGQISNIIVFLDQYTKQLQLQEQQRLQEQQQQPEEGRGGRRKSVSKRKKLKSKFTKKTNKTIRKKSRRHRLNKNIKYK